MVPFLPRLRPAIIGLIGASLLVCVAYSDQEPAGGCVVLTDKGVVMAINHGRNTLQLPGGGREPGETHADAAQRETYEETSLRVTVGALLMATPDQRLRVYRCYLTEPIMDYARLIPVDLEEVREVVVIDPQSMINYDGQKITLPWRTGLVRSYLRLLVPLTQYLQ